MGSRLLGRFAAVSAVMLAIGFVSFGARAWTPAGNALQGVTVEPAIEYPAEGAEVAGPNVLVQWVAPDQSDDGTELHVDLIADDGTIRVDRATNPAVVPRLTPGEHTITLEVQDENDNPVDAGVASVTFTVLYPMPVRLQAGTCDDLDPDPVAVLNDVVSGYSSTGRADLPDGDQDGDPNPPLPTGAETFNLIELSETLLELPLSVLMGEDHSLVLYAPGAQLDGEMEEEEIVACGELGGALYRARLMVGLVPQNDYGAFGIATLTDEGNRSRVRIEVYRDDADPVATPEPTATPSPTATNTPIPTATLAPDDTPVPTNPPVVFPTNTPIPPSTSTPVPTATLAPTSTTQPTAIPTEVPTEAPTEVPPTEPPPPPTEEPPTEPPSGSPEAAA